MRLDCAVYNYENKKLGKLRLLHQFKGSHAVNRQVITVLPCASKEKLEEFMFADVNRKYINAEWFAFAHFYHNENDAMERDLYLGLLKTDYEVRGKEYAEDALRGIAMAADKDKYKILRVRSEDRYVEYYQRLGFKLMSRDEIALFENPDALGKLPCLKAQIKKTVFADFSRFKKDDTLSNFATELMKERGDLRW